MAYPQDTDDLLDGVGEFPPVSRHDLESMIPQEHLDKGIGQGAVTPWHEAAWERVKRHFETKGIDPDRVENTDTITKLKALTCHWVMEMLHTQNTTGPKDHHDTRAEWHANRALNIQAALLVEMPSGKTGPFGRSIQMVRG